MRLGLGTPRTRCAGAPGIHRVLHTGPHAALATEGQQHPLAASLSAQLGRNSGQDAALFFRGVDLLPQATAVRQRLVYADVFWISTLPHRGVGLAT